MKWTEVLAQHGGAASKQQLRDAGATDLALSDAVATGRLLRPRNGRYALPSVSAAVVTALRCGGRLSCVSAARSYGLWGGTDGRVHIHVPPNAGRSEGRDAVVRHWRRRPPHPEVWRVSLVDCLRSVVACADQVTAVAVLDTALSSRRIGIRGLERAFAHEPARSRSIAAQARPGSDSGVESLLRQHLAARGHVVEQQLSLPGVGRVDARVDGLLYVEVDGFGFHADRQAFEKDRLRDTALALRGARWLRVAARHVIDTPDAVVETIEAVLEREELSRAVGI